MIKVICIKDCCNLWLNEFNNLENVFLNKFYYLHKGIYRFVKKEYFYSVHLNETFNSFIGYYKMDNFLTMEEWREYQINKILEK